MIGNGMRLCGAACSILLTVVVSPAVYADDACAGSIIGSVIKPLDRPVTVSLVTPANPDPNAVLIQRFLSGMRNAGITVVQNGQASTVLNTSFVVMDAVQSGPGPTAGIDIRVGNHSRSDYVM